MVSKAMAKRVSGDTVRDHKKYLSTRNGARVYRRIVPALGLPSGTTLRAAVGCVVWSKTYPAAMPESAVWADVDRLARHHDVLLERAKSGEVLDPEVIASAEAKARMIL